MVEFQHMGELAEERRENGRVKDHCMQRTCVFKVESKSCFPGQGFRPFRCLGFRCLGFRCLGFRVQSLELQVVVVFKEGSSCGGGVNGSVNVFNVRVRTRGM
jgi:hypothetical protein